MTLLTLQVFYFSSQSREHLNVPFGPNASRAGFPFPEHMRYPSGCTIYFKLLTFQLEITVGKTQCAQVDFPRLKVSHVCKAVNFKKAHN